MPAIPPSQPAVKTLPLSEYRLPKFDFDTEGLRVPSPFRSPRFHEEFDAPFFEGIADGSITSLPMTPPPTGSHSPASPYNHSHEQLLAGNKLRTQVYHPSPLASQEVVVEDLASQDVVVEESTSKRRPSFNEKIVGWAKKSIAFVRNVSERKQQTDGHRRSAIKGTIVSSPGLDKIVAELRLKDVRNASDARAVIRMISASESD